MIENSCDPVWPIKLIDNEFKALISWKDPELDSTITKDVLRTAIQKPFFNHQENIGCKKLFMLCKALAIMFPKASYV